METPFEIDPAYATLSAKPREALGYRVPPPSATITNTRKHVCFSEGECKPDQEISMAGLGKLKGCALCLTINLRGIHRGRVGGQERQRHGYKDQQQTGNLVFLLGRRAVCQGGKRDDVQ